MPGKHKPAITVDPATLDLWGQNSHFLGAPSPPQAGMSSAPLHPSPSQLNWSPRMSASNPPSRMQSGTVHGRQNPSAASHDQNLAPNRQASSILWTTQNVKENPATLQSLQSPRGGAQMPQGFQSPDAKQSHMYPRSGLTVTASPRSMKGRSQPALQTASPSQLAGHTSQAAGLTSRLQHTNMYHAAQQGAVTSGPAQRGAVAKSSAQRGTVTRSPAEASQAGLGPMVAEDIASPSPVGRDDSRNGHGGQARVDELQEPELWHQLQPANIDLARGGSNLANACV